MPSNSLLAQGEQRIKMVALKILFAMICIWLGLALLLTIPVAIYFLIQEHKKEIEE
jgi:hypothetical protein